MCTHLITKAIYKDTKLQGYECVACGFLVPVNKQYQKNMKNHLGEEITLANWIQNIPIDMHYDEEEALIAYIRYLLALQDKETRLERIG